MSHKTIIRLRPRVLMSSKDRTLCFQACLLKAFSRFLLRTGTMRSEMEYLFCVSALPTVSGRFCPASFSSESSFWSVLVV